MSDGTAYSITCPDCGYTGSERDYDMSCADECLCPECGCDFMLADEEEE